MADRVALEVGRSDLGALAEPYLSWGKLGQLTNPPLPRFPHVINGGSESCSLPGGWEGVKYNTVLHGPVPRGHRGKGVRGGSLTRRGHALPFGMGLSALRGYIWGSGAECWQGKPGGASRSESLCS